ncbi:hypothetical protein C8R43DRAFT_954840 [Mycena crocata]|nr:hypothetical protein C8R43DRAFT_954840 [Mycena crocata]
MSAYDRRVNVGRPEEVFLPPTELAMFKLQCGVVLHVKTNQRPRKVLQVQLRAEELRPKWWRRWQETTPESGFLVKKSHSNCDGQRDIGSVRIQIEQRFQPVIFPASQVAEFLNVANYELCHSTLLNGRWLKTVQASEAMPDGLFIGCFNVDWRRRLGSNSDHLNTGDDAKFGVYLTFVTSLLRLRARKFSCLWGEMYMLRDKWRLENAIMKPGAFSRPRAEHASGKHDSEWKFGNTVATRARSPKNYRSSIIGCFNSSTIHGLVADAIKVTNFNNAKRSNEVTKVISSRDARAELAR